MRQLSYGSGAFCGRMYLLLSSVPRVVNLRSTRDATQPRPGSAIAVQHYASAYIWLKVRTTPFILVLIRDFGDI